MNRIIVSLALVLALVIALPAVAQGPGDSSSKFLRAQGEKVPGQYIVVFKEGFRAAEVAQHLADEHRGNLARVYQGALNGAVINNLDERRAQNLAKRASVAWVEEDGIVTVSATQNNPTWGLDRIDQRTLPLSNSYTYNYDGTGVHVYIIDTGIRDTHNEFGNRATRDFDSINDGQNGNDCRGHGTHVAGTVGGSVYGVAKNAFLHGVRVLNCQGSGTISGVIAGVDWVRNNHISPAVANMSLGGGASSSLDSAVNSAVAAGVTFVVAAGNENQDACNVSPARAADAYTVGSTTSSDSRSSFSNFGTCVDIFAPGSSITAAWHTGDSVTNTISGTSMASPHVAGVAALILDANPGLTPAQVTAKLDEIATCGVLSGIGSGSPNKLLHSLDAVDPNCGGGGGPGGDPDCPTGLTNTYTGSLSSGGNAYHGQGSGSGTFNGELLCSGADFDLYLQKESCSWWSCGFSNVSSSTSAGCNESISHSDTSGTYRWRVYAYSGSGSYKLCTNQP